MERQVNSLRELVSSNLRNLIKDLTTNKLVFSQQIAASLTVLIPTLYLLRKYFKPSSTKRRRSQVDNIDLSDNVGLDVLSTDPGLLKKHSTYESYHVPSTGITYPSIRTFYRPHPQGDKLPNTPSSLPLLVFVHGLGGSVAQFHQLLTSLVNVAPCLAIDFPGCGLSKFAPRQWDAYNTNALVRLLEVVIEQHRDKEHNQGVVLICHSMGCSLSALLASPLIQHYYNFDAASVLGLIAICPVAEPPSASQVGTFRKLLTIPGPIFDLWRAWDRRGGADSVSVSRFVGELADLKTRELQVRFNSQSRTPVWRRMAWGTLPDWSSGQAKGGLPGKDIWGSLQCATYLIAGAADHITPPSGLVKIARFLDKEDIAGEIQRRLNSQAAQTHPPHNDAHHSVFEPEKAVAPSKDQESASGISIGDQSSLQTSKVVLKTTLFPAPASHAVPYNTRTARPLAGYIQTFLANHVDHRLNLGWQLQHLCKEGKWDVKNLEKWQGIAPVSKPIAGLFRALKTLREIDESHTPKVFVTKWSPSVNSSSDQTTQTGGENKGSQEKLGSVHCIVDISHESPVYDPRGLEDGGIAYRKFPTVSKLPPTLDEVKHFIDMIDEIRHEFHLEAKDEATASQTTKNQVFEGAEKGYLAVHCHYGFNRTGFFIICYLVERLNWDLDDAIQEFAKARPPGVKHSHFIDELYARYYSGEGH